MQRQLYLGLLLVTMALATAVCLRPSLGEGGTRLAGSRSGSVGQSVPWPASPAGEATATDRQVGFASSPPPYRSAAPSYRVAGAGRAAAEPQPRYPNAGPARVELDSPPHGRYPIAGPSSPPGRQDGTVAPAIAQAKPCEGTEVLARIGNDVILASEVMPAYHEIMARIPESELAALSPERLEAERKSLLSRLLDGQVQTKLIYQDAKRTIPEERFPEFEKKIADFFMKEELPKRIEKAKVASRAEFDEKLRTMGSSLERMRRGFVQQAMAQQWLQGQREADPKISHGDLLEYYEAHLADYETPARARWEKMSVRIPRYSDGREAYAKLAQMGNQVKQGRSMAEVLRAASGGGLECRGGVQGWVAQGDMQMSEAIEQGIFTLPPGELSGIFEEDGAYHIIRVLQREPFQRTPFDAPEIQKEIRDKIKELRRKEQTEQYLARLKEQIPVWTVFDDDPQLAELRSGSEPSRN